MRWLLNVLVFGRLCCYALCVCIPLVPWHTWSGSGVKVRRPMGLAGRWILNGQERLARLTLLSLDDCEALAAAPTAWLDRRVCTGSAPGLHVSRSFRYLLGIQ